MSAVPLDLNLPKKYGETLSGEALVVPLSFPEGSHGDRGSNQTGLLCVEKSGRARQERRGGLGFRL